jgi:hypothetical protein
MLHAQPTNLALLEIVLVEQGCPIFLTFFLLVKSEWEKLVETHFPSLISLNHLRPFVIETPQFSRILT